MAHKDENLSESELQKRYAADSKIRTRRKGLSPEDVVKIEKLASIGMTEEHIAYIIGVSESYLQAQIRKGREAAERGKTSINNPFIALKRGRAEGDALIAKTAFQLATDKDKPNAAMIMFLARVRLRWAEPAEDKDGAGKETVIFETQMGKDGTIRQAQLEQVQEGGKLIEIPKQKGALK